MDARSPWRIPVMWLVAGLPLAAVVAGVSLVVIASRDSNDAVGDVVQRTAQVQVADIGPDAAARDQGLSAILRIDDGYVELLPVSGRFDTTTPLRLVLRHPAEASQDREVKLEPAGAGWRARVDAAAAHDWKLEVMPEGTPWRLQGRLPRGQRAVHLHPSVPGAGD
jgi:hypothetical protein